MESSFDEEDPVVRSGGDDAHQGLSSKRKKFRSSKMSRYSMPITTTASQDSDDQQDKTASNRRASLPHNMKIPAIKITPSTPSPDPDHPDYPEYFEDRLYLDTMSSVESSTGSRVCNRRLKNG